MADSERRIADDGDPVRILHFLLQSRTRWLICWLLAVGSAGFVAEEAWRSYNDRERGDGNGGHATIDFGGQWLMGRMIVEGQGRHLYQRNYLRSVAQRNYPAGVEKKNAPTDAEALLEWLTGTDDSEAPKVLASFLSPLAAGNALEEATLLANAPTRWTEERLEHVTAPRIGGALYPPVHALCYAPLSLFRPPIAYRLMQGFILALVFFVGWMAQRMTEGRVWWPVASLFVMMFPGFSGCVVLGQNGMFTLTVVLVGWWQLMRGRELLAGLCWGLLAFKPVWAAAFLIVPLMTARWRMAGGMALAGLVQIILTLPVVGWESWWHWLQIGQEAAQEYRRQENWIFLSRDLLGIPRRWLLTFDHALAEDVIWKTSFAGNPWDHPLLAILGWGLWITVLTGTLLVVWRRWRRRKELTGLFPAFLLIGTIFTCYHFMYYDFVVAALPVLLLFAEPSRYFQLRFRSPSRSQCRMQKAECRRKNRLSSLLHSAFCILHWEIPPLPLFLMLAMPAYCCIRDPSHHFPPWDTFVLLFLWAWCGYHLLRTPFSDASCKQEEPQCFREASLNPKFAQLGADVGGAHKRLADQHGADAGRL